MPNLRNGSKGGFEPGLSRLRVWHSTTELLRSTSVLRVRQGWTEGGKNGEGRDGGRKGGKYRMGTRQPVYVPPGLTRWEFFYIMELAQSGIHVEWPICWPSL